MIKKKPHYLLLPPDTAWERRGERQGWKGRAGEVTSAGQTPNVVFPCLVS